MALSEQRRAEFDAALNEGKSAGLSAERRAQFDAALKQPESSLMDKVMTWALTSEDNQGNAQPSWLAKRIATNTADPASIGADYGRLLLRSTADIPLAGAQIAQEQLPNSDIAKTFGESATRVLGETSRQAEDLPAGGIVRALPQIGQTAAIPVGPSIVPQGAKWFLPRIAEMGAKGGVLGAILSYVQPIDEEDIGKRVEARKSQAMQGGKLGGYVGAGGQAVIEGFNGAKYILNKLKSFLPEDAPEAIKIDQALQSPDALKKVEERLKSDFPDEKEYKKFLNSYASKKDTALVEIAGNKTKNLAEGASLYPSGQTLAEDFFGQKLTDMPENLRTTLKKNVSPNSDSYHDALDKIVEEGRAKARPVYDAAFKANPSMSSPRLDRILNTPSGKSALGNAARNIQDQMQYVARPDPDLTEIAGDLAAMGKMQETSGGVASGLKLKTYDYIKKDLDRRIKIAQRDFSSAGQSEASSLIGLKSALVDELDTLDRSGLYAKARSTSGDYLSNKKAMELGRDFFTEDKEIVGRLYDKMGAAEKKSYKTGVLKEIYDRLDKPDGATAIIRQFGKGRGAQQKLNTILNKTEYDNVMADINAANNLKKLANQITGNSRTKLRDIAAQEFTPEGAEIVQDIAQNGIKNMATGRLFTWMKKQFLGLSDKTAGEVAKILYETDPKKKYQIVKALLNQSQKGNQAATDAIVTYHAIKDKIDLNNQTITQQEILNAIKGIPPTVTPNTEEEN